MSCPDLPRGPIHPQLGDLYRYVAWEARRDAFMHLHSSVLGFADWRSGWYAHDESIVDDIVGYLGRAIIAANREPDPNGAYSTHRPLFRGLSAEQSETVLAVARRSARRALDWARRKVGVRRVIARMKEALADYEADETPLISDAEADLAREIVRELEESCEGR